MSRTLLFLLLAACKGDKTGEPGGGGEPPEDDDIAFGDGGTGPCSDTANLELVPLDIWARDLGGAAFSFDHELTYVEDDSTGPGVLVVRYGAARADLQVIVTADDHEDLAFVVTHDGKGGFTWTDPDAGRLATSSETRTIQGKSCPVTTLYIGLDHSWFAATAHAPTQNRFELLMDGDEFWEAVAQDLERVERRVSWSTWWWMSNFELERSDDLTLSESRRWENTAMGMFEALDGVERRVLINRFWDENSDWSEYLNTDAELRDAAGAGGDDFEVVLQGNPTDVPATGEYTVEPADFDFGERVLENPRYAGREVARMIAPRSAVSVDAASYHQKFMVFDGEVAFVTGMNTKSTDWDTNEHLVYEPRRMEFESSTADRQAVEAEEALPDLGPRKDYGARIEGPAVLDTERYFWERWEAAIDGHDLYAEYATHFDLDLAPAEPSGGVPVQVVSTMPEPWSEMSIRESHAKAFAHAQDYIFVEDQYFRAPIMDQIIVEAMNNDPDLVLVVVTVDVSPYDGGAKYTYLADSTYRTLFPDRYLLLQLRSAELVTEEGWYWDDVEVVVADMDTHSKLRLVDDLYLSVGSCNMNNRGYKFEGETNVTVLDEATATAARERVFENLVGDGWASMLSDDPRNNLDVLALAAADNQEILDWWEDNGADLDWDEAESKWSWYRPSGFVYPLQIDSDYQWDVGPDLF